MHSHWWVSPLITVLLFFVGGAVTWGKVGQKLIALCKAQDKLEKRIDMIEPQCGTIVGNAQCRVNQNQCKADVEKKLAQRADALSEKLDIETAKIHKRIDDMHKTVSTHMIDISKFMGKVQAHLNDK